LSFFVFIPARYESTRFPGKPLADIAGKTMIRRVCEQAEKSGAEEVYVATDDKRIADEVTSFGGKVVMTSSDHATGTDRIHEAVKTAGLSAEQIVVNVQGDEPLIPPVVIDQVASAVSDHIEMATLKEPITESGDVFDPNIVKVVVDASDNALYFSRACVPWSREQFAEPDPILPDSQLWFRHLGIYAYTVSLLDRFVSWPIAPLETEESLEQLRVLFNGEKIKVLTSGETMPPGIDVPSDVDRTLKFLESRQ
jgi:3-deoxy-manno-octulosonate cytidylyltransferase (CMP-KDO synthetase)